LIISVARGALGARAPQSEEKILEANLQEKVASAPPGRKCNPGAEQESISLGNWGDFGGGEVI